MADDQTTPAAADVGAPEDPRRDETVLATRAHVVPFFAWLLLLFLFPRLGLPAALGYALRTLACVGLFLWLRPWRWYEGLRLANLPLAVVVGLVVLVVWILPETPWLGRWPALQDFCLRYLMMPLGKLPEPVEVSPFAPDSCGWALIGMRLFGSAVAIAVIEEFFWRGFLYRWLRQQDFLSLDLGVFDWRMFVVACVLFGFEHQRWFVGIIAGLLYCWLAVRTRDLWAASLAHGITNLLLGIYVLKTGMYAFW